eukprot:48969-Eustigmatos_ZCMA.PRE.1
MACGSMRRPHEVISPHVRIDFVLEVRIAFCDMRGVCVSSTYRREAMQYLRALQLMLCLINKQRTAS